MSNNVGKLSQMCRNMVLAPKNESLINQSIFKNINCVNPKTVNTSSVFHFQREDRTYYLHKINGSSSSVIFHLFTFLAY